MGSKLIEATVAAGLLSLVILFNIQNQTNQTTAQKKMSQHDLVMTLRNLIISQTSCTSQQACATTCDSFREYEGVLADDVCPSSTNAKNLSPNFDSYFGENTFGLDSSLSNGEELTSSTKDINWGSDAEPVYLRMMCRKTNKKVCYYHSFDSPTKSTRTWQITLPQTSAGADLIDLSCKGACPPVLCVDPCSSGSGPCQQLDASGQISCSSCSTALNGTCAVAGSISCSDASGKSQCPNICIDKNIPSPACDIGSGPCRNLGGIGGDKVVCSACVAGSCSGGTILCGACPGGPPAPNCTLPCDVGVKPRAGVAYCAAINGSSQQVCTAVNALTMACDDPAATMCPGDPNVCALSCSAGTSGTCRTFDPTTHDVVCAPCNVKSSDGACGKPVMVGSIPTGSVQCGKCSLNVCERNTNTSDDCTNANTNNKVSYCKFYGVTTPKCDGEEGCHISTYCGWPINAATNQCSKSHCTGHPGCALSTNSYCYRSIDYFSKVLLNDQSTNPKYRPLFDPNTKLMRWPKPDSDPSKWPYQ